MLFFRQRLDRFHQRQARIQQREQLMAEQHQRKARVAARKPSQPLARRNREHGIALRLGLARRVDLVHRV